MNLKNTNVKTVTIIYLWNKSSQLKKEFEAKDIAVNYERSAFGYDCISIVAS